MTKLGFLLPKCIIISYIDKRSVGDKRVASLTFRVDGILNRRPFTVYVTFTISFIVLTNQAAWVWKAVGNSE